MNIKDRNYRQSVPQQPSPDPADERWRDERDTGVRWSPRKPEGLARTLAKAGYGSRSKTNQIVHSGRVAVDGRTVFDPSTRVGPDSDIQLDGRPLLEAVRRYYAFHKPSRVIFQAGDPGGRKLVEEFFPADVPGLQPAGRLDARTSGLVLVSNDNAWNDDVVQARSVEKEYRIQLNGELNDHELGLIRTGMALGSMGFLRPHMVEVVERTPRHAILTLSVADAKNRQVYHLFKNLRKEVVYLRRVRIGKISLGNLIAGHLRSLTVAEIRSFQSAVD